MPSIHPGFKDGWFYGPAGCIDRFTTRTILPNKIFFMLTFVPHYQLIKRIGVEIASGGGNKGRLGIYKNDEHNGMPVDLFLDAGEIDISIGGRKEININTNMHSGWYWLAAIFDDECGVKARENSEYNHFYTGTPNILAGPFQTSIDYQYGSLPQTVDVVNVNDDFTSGDTLFIWLRKGV